MLTYLRLKNAAVVEEASLEPGRGFSVLTGETGAGKSIVVESLALLTGGRASEEFIRSGADEALVEAAFEPAEGAALRALLEERGMEPPAPGEPLLLARRIARGGGSRVFVNRAPARVQDLAAIGALLVDLHGQSEQAFLRDASFHREALDSFAENGTLLAEGARLAAELSALEERLKNLREGQAGRAQRMEMLRFQLEDIERNGFQRGEDEALRAEEKVLGQAQKFAEWSRETLDALEGEGGAAEQLSRARRALEKLSELDPAFREAAQMAVEAAVRAEEAAGMVSARTETLDMRPERLAEVQSRLYAMERLMKKYGPTLAAVLDHAERARAELHELEGGGESSETLEARLHEAARAYEAWHGKLASRREKAAKKLKVALEKEFALLALEKAHFETRFAVLPREGSPVKVEGEAAAWGPRGSQRVEFFFQPNPGEDAKPLAKIASGGELARVMLALKTVLLATDSPRTLVFDEVDAGVSGRVAEALGRRLRALAKKHQVLCVTHLPQVAAQGQRHFRVEKKAAKGKTTVSVTELSGKEREEELARLLAGRDVSDTARKHAREMLAAAGEG